MSRYNIGRPGPFGNQFVIGKHGTRAEVVAKHRAWVLAPEQEGFRQSVVSTLGPVLERGDILWCPGCKGTLPCHKTVYEELVQEANNTVTALEREVARLQAGTQEKA